MATSVTSGAVSSSHTSVKPRIGTLATFAPAFFLVGAGAVAYPEAMPAYHLDHSWLHFENALSSKTKAVFETLRSSSTEELVIARLDAIFEELLASQRDLDAEDQKAIASKLWQLYQ